MTITQNTEIKLSKKHTSNKGKPYRNKKNTYAGNNMA